LSLFKEFINKKGYPQWTQVTRVVEGGETPIFKQFFSGWRDEGEQVGLGKVFRQGALGKCSYSTEIIVIVWVSGFIVAF